MSKEIHVFNFSISLTSTDRYTGDDKMKEILGLSTIPGNLKPLLRQPVIPKKFLSPLVNIKNGVHAMLLTSATRDPFFSYIIDPGKAGKIVEYMETAKEKYYTIKAELLANRDKAFQDHLETLKGECIKNSFDNYQGYLDAVAAVQPSKAYLEAQLQFHYLKPRLIELRDDEVEIIRVGVFGQVLHEISQRAKEAVDFDYMTAKLRAVDELTNKLDGLSYIEPQLSSVAAQMKTILTGIPRGIKNDEYQTLHLLAMNGMLQVLMDEDKVAHALSVAQPLFNGRATMPIQPSLTLDEIKETVSAQPENDQPVDVGVSTPAAKPASVMAIDMSAFHAL